MQRRLGMVDLDTGEVLEDQGIPVWVGRKIKLSERFFMAFQDPLEAIAKDKDFSGENMRVLFYLFSKIDFENFIQLPQQKIAEELGIHKANVSKNLRFLTDKGILIEGPKIGRSKSFRLNPQYGWKGKVKNLTEARRARFKTIEGSKGE